jgi:hypothetical protein
MRQICWILLLSVSLQAQIVLHEKASMRDGVQLAADIYLPWPGTSRYPVILMRTPYEKEGLAQLGYALTVEGYAAVIQDTRGHGGSGGEASMFMTEAADGYDTVEWAAARPWSNGAIGSFGASALGISQYLMAGAAPPHLKCMFVIVATPDLHEHAVYPGGCFRKHDIETWARDNGEDAGLALALLHPVRDSLWDIVDLDGTYGNITVPTVHAGGWYDLFAEGTIKAFHTFSKLSGAPGGQMLIMGPWTHGGMGQTTQGQLNYPPDSAGLWLQDLVLQWFGYHLKGEGTDPAASGRVNLYTMGDVLTTSEHWNLWRTFKDFPEGRDRRSYYFHPDGTLSTAKGGGETPLQVLSDPDDPVPTIGGANLVLQAGPYDQSSLLERSDVLAFWSSPMEEPLEVTGHVSALIHFSTDVPDLDVAVRLADIYPDGRWMLVTDGIRKARFREGESREVFLEPGRVIALEVGLGATSYVFAPGHRIGCMVSGSNYPRFDTNPQTGEPVNQGTQHAVPGNVRVYVSSRHASRLILPSSSGSGPHGRPVLSPDGTMLSGVLEAVRTMAGPFQR